MNKAFNSTPHSVTHSVGSSNTVKMPSNGSARTAPVNSPAPLQNLGAKRSRCASCGGGRSKF